LHVLVALIYGVRIVILVMEALSLRHTRLHRAGPKVVKTFVLVCLDEVASYLASFFLLLLLKGQVLRLLLLHGVQVKQAFELRHLFYQLRLLLLLC
jgi:hypothetical protein